MGACRFVPWSCCCSRPACSCSARPRRAPRRRRSATCEIPPPICDRGQEDPPDRDPGPAPRRRPRRRAWSTRSRWSRSAAGWSTGRVSSARRDPAAARWATSGSARTAAARTIATRRHAGPHSRPRLRRDLGRLYAAGGRHDALRRAHGSRPHRARALDADRRARPGREPGAGPRRRRRRAGRHGRRPRDRGQGNGVETPPAPGAAARSAAASATASAARRRGRSSPASRCATCPRVPRRGSVATVALPGPRLVSTRSGSLKLAASSGRRHPGRHDHHDPGDPSAQARAARRGSSCAAAATRGSRRGGAEAHASPRARRSVPVLSLRAGA